MRFPLCALVLLVAPALVEADEPVPAIPVVHTWGDLLKTQPIEVESDAIILPNGSTAALVSGGRARVWAGIDRDHATAHSGAVLYCLARGLNFSKAGRTAFGPFWCRVDPASGWPITVPSGKFMDQDNHIAFTASDYLLFTQTLPLDRPGRDLVGLYSWIQPDKNNPRCLASLALPVAGEPALPWSPLENSPLDHWAYVGGPEPLNSTLVSEIVRNPAAIIAVPRARALCVLHELPHPGTPLPQLISEQPDSGVHLALAGNALLVDVPQRIVSFVPNERFLARWWVNDRPAQLPLNPAPQKESTVEDISGAPHYGKQIRFTLDFQPDRLNAHPGDRIGVQLLFCPDGWNGCADQPTGTPFAGIQPPDRPATVADISFPSNRIDFIYSGDPKNFAQK